MAQERKVPVFRSENSLIEQEFDSVREKFEVEMSKMEEEMSRFRSQLIASSDPTSARLIPPLSSATKSSSSSCSSSTSASSSAISTSTSSRTSHHHQQQVTSSAGNQQAQASIDRLAKSAGKQVHGEQTSRKTCNLESATMDSSSGKRGRSPPSNGHADWLENLNSPLIKQSEDGSGRLLKLRFDVTAYEPEQIVVKTIDNRLQIHAKRQEVSENMSMYREYNREFLLPDGTDPELIRSSLSADGVLTVEAPLPIIRSNFHSINN